ncbi:nucleolar protein 12 [Dendrobium catenatum]|uniref:Ribosomal RNA-processing protein 17 n=1 Tax=Dendrobium catenatum TaxID=906689 RepID=A0A2I0X5N3_9ASPA|nr:nucleolar protein 12 [Dendrobium catenatum]PKU83225.1 hypothetical protein MA16_Dca006625 [Dendrobium catenatum]
MDDEQEFDEGVVVGQKPTVMVPRHINKKSLRNRGLSIAFDEKNLRDFVTGFHKRKDKRRKEAKKQLHEKERQMRIMARKKMKEAKELALKGQLKELDSDLEQDVDSDAKEDGPTTIASVSETRIYENNNTTITVTTSELVNENQDLEPVHTIPKLSNKLEKNHKLPVKIKPMKRATKQKLQKKTSKRSASFKIDGRKKKSK